ncbi:hypothetical protein GF339_19410, partial [candidate division KSB3 bacterium]|nr:hypothetical protein [candidate division KSB3 bacterium]MBD3326761.1 hypothetical protein [candidate division KSB3 bacterium]
MLLFPTYRHKLPHALHPLKPSHYLLLIYWVYFRPSGLKSYFYQALPELYATNKPLSFFRKWREPAFHNLFLMLPLVCLVVTVLGGFSITVLSAWRLDVPINWQAWRTGGMLGVALGVTIGMAFGTVGRIIGGLALSSVVGIVYGITVGIVGGISLSVALGVEFTSLMDGALIVGAVFGLLGGTAFTIDIEIGIALSLAFAVMAGLSFGAEFLLFQVFGMRFGALQVRGVMSGAFVLGALRMLFYPLQWILAFGSLFRHALHPIHWDELIILPLPLAQYVLTRHLREDESEGLLVLKDVARNLFRRNTLQGVLYRHLHKHQAPLRFLYTLLANPAMEEYLLVPLTDQAWDQYRSVRAVFLGELALRPVEATQHPRFRRSARWLNLHRRRPTPLTRFAGMLYDLLETPKRENEEIDLAAYREMYTGVADYPDGKEIALSYETMTTFLSYQTLAE